MRLLLSAVLLLSPHGIGGVHFGTPKAQAVAALARTLGLPTSRSVNPGCGARYTEVAWGGLSAEFRSGRFSGYRYKPGIGPTFATANGITLGSTLARARHAYGTLRRTGADWWRAPNGLFFLDSAMRDPVPPSSGIVEIKIGTCGDF
jgi:hypothetical protein